MNLETMQREGRKTWTLNVLSGELGGTKGDFVLSPKELDQHTANTWKAAQESIKKSILESGLLEERRVRSEEKGGYGDQTHNTLARDIKEFMSNMDKV